MRPTQEDVARRAGVSRALVSLVMRGATNVSPESREAVLAASRELGYRPNANARSLASKQVRTFGVLIHDVTNPYFGLLYSSVADAADRAIQRATHGACHCLPALLHIHDLHAKTGAFHRYITRRGADHERPPRFHSMVATYSAMALLRFR